MQYDQTAMGLAVACYLDDGTLVVKSTGFSAGTWLDWNGYIHSEEMTVTESFKRNGDNLIYNLLRLRRDLGASSTAGLVYTDRTDGDAYNRVFGTDLRVVWRKIWFSQAQLVGAWTRDAAAARAGTLWDLTMYDRTGRAYGNHGEIQGVSPDFVAAAGFVPRTNYVQMTIYNRFSWYGRPGDLVDQVSTFVGLTPLWRYDDFLHLRSTIDCPR